MISFPEELSLHEFFFANSLDGNKVSIVHRIINNATKQHTILIRFHSEDDATLFVDRCNGTLFWDKRSSNACLVVYVSSVRFVLSSEKIDAQDHHSEIPLCPRCLERIDTSASGIIPHGRSDWLFLKCPVCAIVEESNLLVQAAVQGSAKGKPHVSSSSSCPSPKEPQCETCGLRGDDQEGLWVCMTCAHVGCGRYHQSHAVEHYNTTGHRLTLELGTERIWDYLGDGYVHHVFRRKDTSESPCVFGDSGVSKQSSSGSSCTEEPEVSEEEQELVNIKLESIASHYNQLLTSQLEEQYSYFESKIAEVDRTLCAELEEWKQNRLPAVQEQLAACQEEVSALQIRKRGLDKKITSTAQQLAKATESTKFLSDLQVTLNDEQLNLQAITEQDKENAKRLAKIARDKDLTIQSLQRRVDEMLMAVSQGKH